MQQLFGREPEIALLNAVFTSRRAEFVALYGRLRVGKTYLIREYFKGRETLYFEFTGQKDATLTVQLHDFKEALQTVFYAGKPIPSLTERCRDFFGHHGEL
jgi:AAA+ ATPase superfamily predicted ATPase